MSRTETSNRLHGPLAALWRPGSLLAVLASGEALALVMALAPGRNTDGLVYFGLVSLSIQWITVGVLCLLYLMRKPLGRLAPLRIAWICLSLLLGMTLLVSCATKELLHLATASDQARMPFIAQMLGLALVVGLLGLVGYHNYWRARQLAIRTKQLELESLQARIRPHFLFNTLNTCVSLVHAQPDAAERILLDLADLFRSALQKPQQVPLATELDLTRRYLAIEALRLGPRLQLTWSEPEPLPDVLVPSLSIQPLAENAIRHGIEPSPQGGRMEVTVRIFDGMVDIVVSNDTSDLEPRHRGHALGVVSARERVQALTDGQGRIDASQEGGRYIARMRLPVQKPPV